MGVGGSRTRFVQVMHFHNKNSRLLYYLFFFQGIAAPQFIAFAIGYGFQDLDVDPSDQFHVWEIIFVAGLISAIVLLCSTSIGKLYLVETIISK